jgi:ubiquinone biosynthesis protein
VIVWLDLGMMGRLSEMDGSMFTRLVGAVALNDVETVTDIVLAIGVYRELPDRARLSSDIEVLLARYRQMPLSSINARGLLEEFLALARRYEISMPANMTMLGRSVAILESVLTTLDPNTNLLKIMSSHIQKHVFDGNVRERVEKLAWQFAESSEKLTAIPGQLSDALTKVLAGHATVNVNVSGQGQESRAQDRRSRRLALALLAAALIVSAGIVCLSDMPGIAGLPWLSAAFLGGATVSLAAMFFPSRR